MAARLRTTRRGPGRTVALLAGFAVLCGLFLLLAGPRRGDDRLEAVGDPLRRQLTAEVLRLMTHVHSAEEALNANDYGRSREAIIQVRRNLSGLLAAIQDFGPEDKLGSKATR